MTSKAAKAPSKTPDTEGDDSAAGSDTCRAALTARLRLVSDKLTQAEISRRTGFLDSNVSRYMSGRKAPAEFCVALVEKCGVNGNWLMTGRGTPFVADVGTETAPQGSGGTSATDLLDLVHSMEAVSKLRFGALAGGQRPVLRELDDALKHYEETRERVAKQTQPVLAKLLDAFEEAANSRDFERTRALSRALEQALRICDDDEASARFYRIRSSARFDLKDIGAAWSDLRRALSLSLTTDTLGGMGGPALEASSQIASALVGMGRAREAKFICIGLSGMVRASGLSQKQCAPITAIRAWCEYQLGYPRKASRLMRAALPDTPRDDRCMFEALEYCFGMVQSVHDGHNVPPSFLHANSLGTIVFNLLTYAYWFEDGAMIERLLDQFFGDSPPKIGSKNPAAVTARATLEALKHPRPGLAADFEQRFDAVLNKELSKTPLAAISNTITRSRISRLCGAYDTAWHAVRDIDRERLALADGVTPGPNADITHALNVIRLAQVSAPANDADRAIVERAHHFIRRMIRRGFRCLERCVPAGVSGAEKTS